MRRWQSLGLLVLIVFALPLIYVRDSERTCPAAEGGGADQNSREREEGATSDNLFEQILAQKFSPVFFIDPKDYTPKDVQIAWNESRRVRLHVDGPDPICSIGVPTGDNPLLHNKNAYLDFPGNVDAVLTPLRDLYKFRAALLEDTTYAHLRLEAGYLAIQYWLYYYFNDAPLGLADHEGDWEMVELLFQAPDCTDVSACAFTLLADGAEPIIAAYAQHSCREMRYWTEVSTDGGHPFVFVARGTHASYFQPFTRFQFRGACGTGLEIVSGPPTATPISPRVVLLPDPDDDSDLIDTGFEWLAFKGRWGQWDKPGCSCAGPTGPRAKPRWRTPYSWALDLKPGP